MTNSASAGHDGPAGRPVYTPDDEDRKEAITAALQDPAFPSSREDLLARAEASGAKEAVLVDLRSLPDGARYDTYDDVLVALGVGSAGRVDVPGAPARDPSGGTQPSA